MKNIKTSIFSILQRISAGNLILKSVVFALTVSLIFQFALLGQKCDEIRDSVFRLHILANSDSDADQSLKLKVRDRIIRESTELFKDAETREDAIKISEENLDFLAGAAQEEIARNGYDYSVKISVGDADFNTRKYENATLPAGRYTALRVVIGEGKGKNWWCVMFPPMCISAATDKVDNLQDVMEKEQLDLVCNGEKYRVKFKVVEVYEGIKSAMRKNEK